MCKFYDGGVVKVGTASDRFTMRVPAEDESWVATRVRAELINRELAAADELPMDEAGEAAMAAKSTAVAQEAAKKATWKRLVAAEKACPTRKAAAALEAAEHHVAVAEQKRQLAESTAKLVGLKAKVAKVAPFVAQLAKVEPKAAALQTKLDAFMNVH